MGTEWEQSNIFIFSEIIMNNQYQLNDSHEYFFEYWEDYFSKNSATSYLFKSFNIRVLIQELLDEITINKQRNINNELFFKKKIGELIKKDKGISSNLSIYLSKILKEFDTFSNRRKYFPVLCKEALDYFNEGGYLANCINSLNRILKDNDFEKNKESIEIIANSIIVEFRLIGYSDKEIKRFSSSIMSEPKKRENIFFWEFPYKESLFEDLGRNKDIFEKELTNINKSLTIEDRIHSLNNYEKRKKENITYIFRVNGIINAKDFEFMDVRYYSPHEFNISKKPNREEKFDFDDEINFVGKVSGKNIVNAAVVVNTLSPADGLESAKSKINKSLDVLRRIFSCKSQLTISASYLAVDSEGKGRGSSWSIQDNHPGLPNDMMDFAYITPLEQENKIEQITKIIKSTEDNSWDKKFLEACYWLRKAEESSSKTEELLCYWITIETLCSKNSDSKENWFETKNNEKETDIFIIREIAGKIIAINESYSFGWRIYSSLDQTLFNKVRIPTELAKKADLIRTPGKTIHLSSLIENCDELIECIDNPYYCHQLKKLKEFYKDSDYAISCLSSYRQTAEDELLMIYRMRNKIAHDGNSNHMLLNSICDIAKKYALCIFNKLSHSSTQINLGFEYLLIREVQKYEIIENRLNDRESPSSIFLNS